MTTHKHWSLGVKLALVALRQKTYVTALRQYLSLLAGEAALWGLISKPLTRLWFSRAPSTSSA